MHTISMQPVFAAYDAWQAADDAWHQQLVTEFGRDAGTIRYTEVGRGREGTELRRRYTAFCEAREAYHAARIEMERA